MHLFAYHFAADALEFPHVWSKKELFSSLNLVADELKEVDLSKNYCTLFSPILLYSRIDYLLIVAH